MIYQNALVMKEKKILDITKCSGISDMFVRLLPYKAALLFVLLNLTF